MGRYSSDDGLGLEFLGLLTPSNAAIEHAGSKPTQRPPTLSESWSLELSDSEPVGVAEAPPPAVPHVVQPVDWPSFTAAQVSPVHGTAPLTRREARALEEAGLAADALAPAGRPHTQHTLIHTAATRRVSTAAAQPPKSAKPVHPRTHISAGSKLLSLGAMLFAGALVIGMSVPVNALMSNATPLAAAVAGTAPRQSQLVDISSAAAPVAAARDNFTVISYADIMRLQYGNVAYTFTPTTGAVRWPFPYSVPISDGWGSRVQPCWGCSTFHQGVDFTPGGGSPIYAIADGVVATHDDTNYGLGNSVVISHLINGQHIDSVYAHMLTGSSKLQPGDIIKVGDFVGLVGDTGSSTGNHLHFEIHVDKVPVDPFAWLTANAIN